ncbi:unnamed protein product [Agarophyton chilense]
MDTPICTKPSPIEEWNSNFNNQVSALRALLPVRSAGNGDAADEQVSTAFEAACKSLADVDQMFSTLKQYIQQEEAQLNQLKKLQSHIQRASSQMKFIEKQMPEELQASLNATDRDQEGMPLSRPNSKDSEESNVLVNNTGNRPTKSMIERNSSLRGKKPPPAKSPIKTTSKTTKRRGGKSREEPISDPPQIRYVTQEELDEAPQNTHF